MTTPSALHVFASRFHGQLLASGDEGYDAARSVFNAMIDRRPALIARCTDAADVAAAVRLAREQDLVVSVRCAGHNVAGYAVCDGGLVIDLSPMKGLRIDPGARVARVEAGLTWGEVNDALQPYGLAAAGGFVSLTGVSGLTLGGGLGWLVRKHGLALDNMLSAEVVLAGGDHVTASASENDDLFWAIRGGGGNFGIVTAFTFRVHPAGTVLAGVVLHPLADGRAVLRHWRDFERTSPEEYTQGALLFHFPEGPDGPAPLRGVPVIGVGGVYTGDIAKGERVVRPIRDFRAPLADLFAPIPYNGAQRMADFLWPPGLHNYWKSSFLQDMSDGAIDVILDFFGRVPSPRTVIVLEHNGRGAMDRVPEDATAFGHRRWPFNFLVTSAWSDRADTERNISWTRAFFDAMRPFSANAAYVNYLAEEPDGARRAYGEEKYARLAALKLRYDPTNLFRMNQNIAPAAVV